jgi:hypothetical protein
MVALTLPLWTFLTIYVILILINYLRHMQYFYLYDKCTSRNAHFRYDFHIIVGKHSHNYNRNEYLILDLLDNHSVSSTTIQIPGTTIFNDYQVFMYRHARSNLRCVQFSVYRRHPIKDVKSIRVAHSCSSPDSRLYVYGLDLYDDTNGENKFFPIMSVVRYRGTQWALATTFEPKTDVNFKKLGADCYDPFGDSNWPTYMELLTITLYIWCSSFCFGHLISVRQINNQVTLHCLTIVFVVASSTAVLSAIYLRFIKGRIVSGHYESNWWYIAKQLYLLLLLGVSIAFWTLALRQKEQCTEWITSTYICSTIVTFVLFLSWLIACYKRSGRDSSALGETDTNLAKTNSKDGIQFINDPALGFCASLRTTQESSTSRRMNEQARASMPRAIVTKNLSKSVDRKVVRDSGGGRQKRTDDAAAKKNEDNETLDTAYGQQGSRHMRVKNRNSISQYV